MHKNSTILRTRVFPACICLIVSTLFWSVSADQFDSRISTLQGQISSLSQTLVNLRGDSASAAADYARSASSQSQKVGGLDGLIGQKSQEIADLRRAADKTRADSVALSFKQRDRALYFQKEIARLEASSNAITTEIAALTKRASQMDQSPGGTATDQRAVAAFLSQATQRETDIRTAGSEKADGLAKLDQARRDSAQFESVKISERNRFIAEGKRLDAQLSGIRAELNQITAKWQSSTGGVSAAQNQEKQKLAQLTRSRADIDTKIAATIADLAAYSKERDRLQQSFGATQARFGQQKLPLESALASASSELKAATGDKDVYANIKQKFLCDQQLSKERNELDKLIEAQARGQKNTTKLIDAKENQISELSAKQDEYARKPGVLAKQSQINAPTIAQKIVLVDSLRIAAEQSLVDLKTRAQKAQQQYDAFVNSSPLASAPEQLRLNKLDTLIETATLKQAELAANGDSFDQQIAMSQSSIDNFGATVTRESAALDGASRSKNNELSAILAQRTQVSRDSMTSETAVNGSILQVRGTIARIAGQNGLVDRKIEQLAADRDRLKQSAADAQNRSQQADVTRATERQRLDSETAVKQQQVDAIFGQIAKLRQDSMTEAGKNEAALAVYSTSLTYQTIVMRERDLAQLRAQRDDANRSVLAEQGQSAERVRKVTRDISAAALEMSAKQSELRGVQAQQQENIASASRQKQTLDARISALDQECAAVISVRDRARQDSIAAEGAKADVAYGQSSATRTKDLEISGAQQQLAGAQAQVASRLGDSPASTEVRRFDTLIVHKERELADLRAQREQARQGIYAEQRQQGDALRTVHDAIISQVSQVLQKQSAINVLITNRRRMSIDSTAAQRKNETAVASAAAVIARQNQLLSAKQSELNQARSDRARLDGMSYSAPAPVVQQTPSYSAPQAEQAQKLLEEIYTKMSEGNNSAAIGLFKRNSAMLKRNLEPDVFNGLDVTVKSLGK